jgi:hypothetical protein
MGSQVARGLAGLAGGFGVVLAAALVVHAVRTAGDDVHSASDVTWVSVVATFAALAGLSLLFGVVRWTGRTAWWLRLAGVLGLLFATLGSLSWVLPLLAPVAPLALPSLTYSARADFE